MQYSITGIYVGNQKSRPPASPWWQPSANTISYLPLSVDANDAKWMGVALNWTTTNITFSDNKAVFNSSGTSCILFDTTSLPTTFTLHFIVAITTLSGYQVWFRYSYWSGYDNSRCYLYWYSQWINFALCGSNYQSTIKVTDTNEHLYSYVIQPDWVNNTKMDFYIDGVNKNINLSKSNQSYANAKLSLWNRWYNKNEWLKWTMREVILESTYRTNAEVLALAQQFWFA